MGTKILKMLALAGFGYGMMQVGEFYFAIRYILMSEANEKKAHELRMDIRAMIRELGLNWCE